MTNPTERVKRCWRRTGGYRFTLFYLIAKAINNSREQACKAYSLLFDADISTTAYSTKKASVVSLMPKNGWQFLIDRNSSTAFLSIFFLSIFSLTQNTSQISYQTQPTLTQLLICTLRTIVQIPTYSLLMHKGKLL